VILEFGPFVIDLRRRRLFHGLSPVPITCKPFEVLLYLAENPGRVVEKDEILQAIWKGVSVSQPNLAQTIFVLRNALKKHDPSPYIITFPGQGYQFGAEVRKSHGEFGPKASPHLYICSRRVPSPVQQIFGNYTTQSLKAVIQESEAAMRHEPGRASAYVDYANALCLLLSTGVIASHQAFPAIQDALLRALEIDPNAGSPYAPLGFIRCHMDRDWARAEEDFQRALSACPDDLMALHWYAELLTARKRFDDSLKVLRRAEKFHPHSTLIQTDIAQILFHAQAYADCEAQLLRAIGQGKDFPFANVLLGCTYRFRQRYDQSVRVLERVVAAHESNALALASLAATRGFLGDVRAAAILKRMQSFRAKYYVSPSLIAFAAAGLGKTRAVLHFLELGEKENDYWFLWFSGKSIFDPLRREPRFQDLMQKARIA
jgi:DNA-binding winged helix-turn-helix (wHTH) protein